MGKYSIKELEKLSGIKAHTIRIWEKRHKIIAPARTTTNIRFYSDDDLKKLINVSLLNNNGIKISRIAEMSMEEMNHKVLEISELHNDAAVHIDQLVLAMIGLDEEIFEKNLNTLILRYGFEKTIADIIYPFLEKIGILWQTQNITPAHEHFISNLIRQKIIVAIDGLTLPAKGTRKALLYLPEGEMHELGLLFYNFLTRKAGYRTYYLGQNVPHEDLVRIIAIHQPGILITVITGPLPGSLETYFKKLSADFPDITVLASGVQTTRFQGEKVGNVQTFSTPAELQRFF
jgi:DNA-binding transcriptional MerR regulator